MSDGGERTCPLCAEEMDLTDQQLKPCKCGYEICVWCWHHIMDMAEKDDTEGRCPACRTPYDKEKIVGTAANCERLVAEMNMEKKFKTQKGKTRTEGRKQLSSARVIQRNLVYIVGLPLSLADEELLQRKEYFGQYGKVLKVSISRTAAGVIQQFTNNTCSVYITYSKEDEAVRCIQSVHGFILEGRPLRACFGTTKYCHAWLRNVPCSNPDCLYLHEIGSQEDSFTKDEIISAYTRSRVQQITGATNSMQRRSGNVLPPPADDYCNNSSASSGNKPTSKSATNTLSSSIKISPPNSSSGRSVALPAGASWGSRASNNQLTSSLPSSNEPQKLKPDACNGPVAISTALPSSNHVPSLHSDAAKKLVPGEGNDTTQVESKKMSEPIKRNLVSDCQTGASGAPISSGHHTRTTINSKLYDLPASRDKDKHVILSPKTTNSDDTSSESSGSGSVKDLKDDLDEKVRNLSSDMLSMSIDNRHGLEQVYLEPFRDPLTSQAAGTAVESNSEICVLGIKTGCDSETPGMQVTPYEDALPSFDDQRMKDPEVPSDASYLPNISHSPLPTQNHRGYSLINDGPFTVDGDLQVVDNKVDSVSQLLGTPILSSGYPENPFKNFTSLVNNVEHSYLFSNDDKSKHGRRCDTEVSNTGNNAALDMGESSIISNILSLDFDSWDESLTSPQNLAKFLGESGKRQVSHSLASPWKVQQSNQSRFSFAREEEPINQVPDGDSSLSYTDQAFKPQYFSNDFSNKTSFNLDRFATQNGVSLVAEEPDTFTSSHSLFNSSKLPVSRSQKSAPPGFSTSSRAPPPGFMSHERMEQTFNSFSGHHILDPSLQRNQYQSTQAGNIISNGDIEFVDPAILAVGRGRIPDGLNSAGVDMPSSFPSQLNTLENDSKIQLLMQRSLSSHQNQRFTDMGDAFSSFADSLRNPSRFMEQSLVNNIPAFSQVNLPQSRNPLMSNGLWDGWNEVQSGNNMGMAELLRPERLGFNKYYTGYEDSKLRMPSQGDLYNRTFGI